MRKLALVIATAGGAGLAPIAPGTFGSAVGVIVYWLTRSWSVPTQLTIAAVITVVGIWASSEAAKHYNREDPGQVVVDEVAGQLVTMFFTGAGWWATVVGFFLFRVFDIIKPYPANRLERLHGGLGIMADDLMAGVYACITLHLIMRFVPGVA